MENTSISKELEEFQKKKEDIFKNMGMLNNLSEKLSHNIHEEEKRIEDLQSKEIVENKKKQADNEIQLLEIENSKMERYLEILQKKHDLELQFIEKICEQNAKVEKLGDKYPHIDIKGVHNCDDYYYTEVKNITASNRTRSKEGANHTPHNSVYMPVYADSNNTSLPSRSSVSALFNKADNSNSHHHAPPPPPPQASSGTTTQPTQSSSPTDAPKTHQTAVSSTTPAASQVENKQATAPPQRRMSLQDQLTAAINSKQFQHAMRGPPDEHADNGSDGGFSP